MTTLLGKPLLDLWVFENGDSECCYNGDRDDDAWSVALAFVVDEGVVGIELRMISCSDSLTERTSCTMHVGVRARNISSQYVGRWNVPLTAAAGIFATLLAKT